MFRIQVHEYIERMNSIFYRFGFWHRDDVPTVGEWRLKIFYSIYFPLFTISLATGACKSADFDEAILSFEFALIAAVLVVKLFYIIWRKKEILELLNRICVYTVEDVDTFKTVNEKLNFLMKFLAIYFGMGCFNGLFFAVVSPFLRSDKTLFLKIGFPLDWKNDEVAYWIALTFLMTEVFIGLVATLFTAIFCYLIINCSLRFEVLGQKIKTMGNARSDERIGVANGRKMSDTERDHLYLRDLLERIKSHAHLKELMNELDLFLSESFVIQLTTSALSICCSIYCLVFVSYIFRVTIGPRVPIASSVLFIKSTVVDSVEYIVLSIALFYNIFDIFMVTNFGNEIERASSRLFYCMYESNWVDRPQSTKKIVLIFSEFLIQPHQLFVLKLYPLNLETFTRILKSAYSSFNILQNFK